jgi:cytochrome bd ubiquinol oxidase subunit II
METLWFCLVAVMLALYVVLDGFDLGAGAIHLWVARTDMERRLVLRSIGPVWDGNEVWLLAGGGTLFFAFPRLYASSFSGFYLPLMIVLWLLMLRGISIEFRNHLKGPAWRPCWDAVFCGSSALLVVFYGAALGNVVRGVPLDSEGHFFLPLWVDLTLGPESGILDWYTILAGVTALAALVVHGALWVALKTEGDLRGRCRRLAGRVWVALVLLTALLTVVTFRVQAHVPDRLREQPGGLVFAVLAVGGLFSMRPLSRRGSDRKAFLASCAYLLGMLTSAAFGLYPYVLPAKTAAANSLTIYNASAGGYGLRIGLGWWIPGILLATAYFRFTYRNFGGKVKIEEGGY